MDSPILIVAAFVLVTALLKAITVVPGDRQYVIERMGRLNRVLNPGLHFIVPFIDTIRVRYSLAESLIAMPKFTIPKRDFGARTIEGETRYQIVDAKALYTAVPDHLSALALLTQTIARGVAQNVELNSGPSARSEFESQMTTRLQEGAKSWGIKILGFHLADSSL